MQLTNKQLFNISGGAIITKSLIFGGIITFIIGVIDGILRPLKCNR